jgi:hypothetical protein
MQRVGCLQGDPAEVFIIQLRSADFDKKNPDRMMWDAHSDVDPDVTAVAADNYK